MKTRARVFGTMLAAVMSWGVPRALVAQSPIVTPDGGGSGTVNRLVNSTGQQVIFLATNLLTTRTYSFSISCSGPITNCVMTRGSSITNTTSANWPVTFNTTGTPGTATMLLTVTGNGGSDQGTWIVKVRLANSVAVTPDAGSAPQRFQNTGGYSETFTVTNTGMNNNTFSFVCSGANGVTCGTVPAPVLVNGQDGSAQVTMPYSVGAVGTGTLTLTASAAGASDPGSFSVPIVTAGVSVTPDAQITPTRFSGTTGLSESFTVTNIGSADNTYTFTCATTGGIVCSGVPSPMLLHSNESRNVPITYNTGAEGTGTLTLTAAGTGPADQGSFSIPVAPVLSQVSMTNGVMQLNLDSRFLLQATANAYDAGRVGQVTDARGYITDYSYGGNANNAFLIQVKRWKNGPGSEYLATDIAYDASGFVASIKDEGGSFKYFTYDGYGRLRQIKNNGQTPVRAYGYTYSRTSANSWVFQASAPNAVVDTAFIQASPFKGVVATGYLDGLGRGIQTVVQDGTNYHVSATQYDLMGRIWRAWRPYRRLNAGYDANFAATATDSANIYHGASTAKPYTETTYTNDALSRVRRVTPEYIGTTPPYFALTSYGLVASPSVNQQIVEITDESGKKRRTFNDAFGYVVRSVLGSTAPESTVTQFVNDVLGQRTQATDPRGLLTTYVRDTRGLLTGRTSPDAGTVNSKYDKGGNLRFSQDASQAAAGQVYFTNYDFAGRALTSGLGTATFAPDPDGAPTALETIQGNWLVVQQYDGPAPVTFPWNLFPTPPPLTNITGRLVGVASKSNNAWQVTYFSYDADGQVATRYTYTQANGGGSVLTVLNTTVSYFRDLRGALTKRDLVVGSATFYHWYEYDGRGLLSKTYASTTTGQPTNADVTDRYRPSGQPQDYQFQGGPLVPIRYTIRGQTETVGDPTLVACPACPFSARYAYHPNGTVSEAEFYSAGSPAAQKRYRYVFALASYDALNRLKGADFSSWSGSAWTVTPAYDLGGASYNGILYDAAGNLTALQRNRETGTVLDNLTYTIAPTSNRLTQIGDAVDGTPESWDAEDGSFTYDPNGNLLTAPAAPYSIATAITYNYQNLPVSLTSGANTATYRYDDAGQRITKQVNGGNTEVYLREGPTTLGVFTVNSAGTPLSSYFNILWDDRVVGRQTILPTATRTYNHFDALGSTRAVVLSTTGAVVESYDFEPWGLLMAGRTLASATPTKEGFTGKEQDAETGLDYFGARYYMPAIGRWAAVDPSADATPEWSPYNYVLDNPGTHTDPDGRQVPLYDLFKAGLRLAGTGNSDFAAASRGTVSGLERVEASVMSPVTDPVGTLAGIGTMARAGQGDVDAQAQITAGVVSAVDERVDRWNNGGIEGKFDVAWEGALTLASMVGPAAISKVGAAGEVMNVSRLPAAAAGKTTGLLRTAAGETPLVSGVAGPAASMPRGAPGFDIVTRTHVEGHAAATMHQTGARAGTLVISKAPCASCSRLLPRMLPSGSQLRIVSVQGLDKIFKSQM